MRSFPVEVPLPVATSRERAVSEMKKSEARLCHRRCSHSFATIMFCMKKLPTYFNLAFNTDVHRCRKLLINT